MKKTKTLYLAHNFYDRKSVRKFELHIEKLYNIRLDNPFYDNDRNDIKELDKLEDHSTEQEKYFKERNTASMCDNIVDGDLDMIRKSDGLLTIIKEASIGTAMEIFYASRVINIPVYVVTVKYAHHPWIQKYATRIFSTLNKFEAFSVKEFGIR